MYKETKCKLRAIPTVVNMDIRPTDSFRFNGFKSDGMLKKKINHIILEDVYYSVYDNDR